MNQPPAITAADLPELSRRFREARGSGSHTPEELQTIFEATLTSYLDCTELEPGSASHLLLEAWLLRKPEAANAADGEIACWPRRYAGWLLVDRVPMDRDEIQGMLRFVEDTGAELDPEQAAED